MKIRYLFVFLCISLLFSVNLNTAEASTIKAFASPVIFIQNKNAAEENYPVVNEIETKVLGKNFSAEDIYIRLDRLETSLFGRVSQKSLSDRVDDLSKAVLESNNNPEESDSESLESSSNEESLKNLLGQLENKLMDQVYPNDSVETRVSRLENFIFNQSSTDYPMKERIERLATVVNAQPSNEINNDIAQLGNNQIAGQELGLAALILMIVAGLVF